ncbi:MAG: PIN domain-containing protein [Spirochaetaceae bacterium]|nr:MAG: PIN domain-containing protein [Spirochaetaceae bacterium]
MILIDTSVWVRFFKGSEDAKFIAEKIRENAALLHPLVFGELLLGGISTQIESLLQALPSAQLASTETIFRFIKQHTLPGKGIGWVDAALLCSVQEAGAVLATFDETLRSCAEDIGIACLVIA